MYQYIVTAFKVMVGVITNERLAIVAAVALGLMLLWVIFSLIFSFQVRFARGARKINEYISKNGMTASSKSGLDALTSKMSSEFQRGYKNFNANPGSLPSDHIKRFQSLDVELTGGVFNQNKSIIKTYINFIFAGLLLFSIAILSTEEALTGAALGEAAICPFMFLLVAKIIYYVYTAIRQHQYKVAVDEFNDMLDNMDQAVRQERANGATDQGEQAQPVIDVDTDKINVAIKEYLDNYFATSPVQVDNQHMEELETRLEDSLEELASLKEQIVETTNSYAVALENAKTQKVEEKPTEVEEKPAEADAQAAQKVEEKPAKKAKQKPAAVTEESEAKQSEAEVEEIKRALEDLVDEDSVAGAQEDENNQTEETQKEEETMAENKDEAVDNFKLDFSDLIDSDNDDDDDDEEVLPKRGRGRPKKEVNQPGEFVIKTDKDFEEALVRAEKLMRKNEEPLSPSQTKRIEKQIKELVDAMTKYKEGK